MKKNLLLSILFILSLGLFTSAQAQWQQQTGGNMFLQGSNISDYNSNDMTAGGSLVSIRQAENNLKRVALLQLNSFNGMGAIGVTYNFTNNADMIFGVNNGNWDWGSNIIERMRIKANGNVLIGKLSQSNNAYKLDVAGKVRADEIVVNTTGADFVFAPDYQLRPLSEVESHIKEHGYLPEVPSAATMQEEGMSLAETTTLLLQKIEELTLYAIEQEKKIKKLEELLEGQKK